MANEVPRFDRSHIAHVTPTKGFAIVNGCQGIFMDMIHWRFEDALAEFNKLGRFSEEEPDWQIVQVEVKVAPDSGVYDEFEQNFFPENFLDPTVRHP